MSQFTTTLRRLPAFAALVLSCGLALGTLANPCQGVDVLTQHNDIARTGANTAETVLTAANVVPATFGKLFSAPVDMEIYSQPLYVDSVMINGLLHNVAIVCTENNTVYAIDTEDPTGPAPLWSRTLLPSLDNPNAEVGTTDIDLRIGITSTPVIDRANGIIYLVAKSLETGTYYNTLYALDLATGANKASINGGNFARIAANSPLGTATLTAQRHQNRPGLLLLNGELYLGFGSHGDTAPYNGWVLAYNASTLNLDHVFCTTDNGAGNQGAVWQSGNGLMSDGSSIYLMTGNGDSTMKSGGVGLSETFLKLSPGLALLDWFMPNNADALNDGDVDLGSGGPLYIPTGGGLVLGSGKAAVAYVLSSSAFTTDGLHYNGSADNVLHTFGIGSAGIGGDNMPGFVYWQGPTTQYVYVWGANSNARQFTLSGTAFTAGSSGTTAQTDRAGGISLSANGRTTGTAILWGAESNNVLHAYNAENMAETWNSSMNAARDGLPTFSKLSCPTVANGKVLTPTFSNTMVVYGLLTALTPTLAPSPFSPASGVPGTVITITGTHLYGTTSVSFGGVAGTGLSVNGNGTKITVTVPGGAATGAVTVTTGEGSISSGATTFGVPGPASALHFAATPANTVINTAIAPAVQVEIVDSLGLVVNSSTASVTLALGANPGGGGLAGTTTVAAVAGVASFSNLSISAIGNGYTLGATSAGLTATTSAAFNIVSPPSSSGHHCGLGHVFGLACLMALVLVMRLLIKLRLAGK